MDDWVSILVGVIGVFLAICLIAIILSVMVTVAGPLFLLFLVLLAFAAGRLLR